MQNNHKRHQNVFHMTGSQKFIEPYFSKLLTLPYTTLMTGF
jgi:hypothetical protein